MRSSSEKTRSIRLLRKDPTLHNEQDFCQNCRSYHCEEDRLLRRWPLTCTGWPHTHDCSTRCPTPDSVPLLGWGSLGTGSQHCSGNQIGLLGIPGKKMMGCVGVQAGSDLLLDIRRFASPTLLHKSTRRTHNFWPHPLKQPACPSGCVT